MKTLILFIIFFSFNLQSQWKSNGYADELILPSNEIEHVRPSINGKDLIVQYEKDIFYYDLTSGIISQKINLGFISSRNNSLKNKLLNLSEDYISSINHYTMKNYVDIDSIFNLSIGLNDTSKSNKTLIHVQKPDYRIYEFSKFINLYEENGSYFYSNEFSYVNAVNEATSMENIF